MTKSQARSVYDDAIKRYNAGDMQGFADAHAEDAVLVTPMGTVQGRASIRDYWRHQLAAYPDLALNVGVVVEQDELIAAEWSWAGTNTGPLLGRDGTRLPPTGRRVEVHGMELVKVRDGKITEYRMYWDSTAIARQLGQLPAKGND